MSVERSGEDLTMFQLNGAERPHTHDDLQKQSCFQGMTHALRQQTWASHMLATCLSQRFERRTPKAPPFLEQATLAMPPVVWQGIAFGVPRCYLPFPLTPDIPGGFESSGSRSFPAP
jgi:hypothetical protein